MNIQPYLPSKKIRIIIIILFVILCAYIGSILVRQYSVQESDTVNTIDVALVNDEQKKEYYQDSDGDGAYDWEEALWPELDPNNPDSDGDGVLDGKYIATKQAIQERERRGVSTESNLTETEKFGRSAYTALLALVQSGSSLDEQTTDQFSDNLAGYIQDLTLGEKLYLRSEMNLVEDSQENAYVYRTRMKKLFAQYPVATTDVELILESSEDPEQYRSQLRPLSVKYNDYLTELVATETPFIIGGRHTELVNNISQIAAAFDNLLAEEQDELVSLSFLVQLESILNQTAESIIKINTFFEIIDDESIFAS